MLAGFIRVALELLMVVFYADSLVEGLGGSKRTLVSCKASLFLHVGNEIFIADVLSLSRLLSSQAPVGLLVGLLHYLVVV